jgi:hypothetical protein
LKNSSSGTTKNPSSAEMTDCMEKGIKNIDKIKIKINNTLYIDNLLLRIEIV